MSIDNLIPWGRSSNEYYSMFRFSIDDYASILSIADGPSSFQAENPDKNIVSIDPLYAYSTSEIKQAIEKLTPSMKTHLEEHYEEYNWTFFKSPKEVINHRLQTASMFLEHFKTSPERYLPQSLPNLTHSLNVDLIICSHYLFLNTDTQTTQFHIDTIFGLTRLSNDVRIYPLVNPRGNSSKHLPSVLTFLQKNSIPYSLLPVSKPFQKTATHYLRIQS